MSDDKTTTAFEPTRSLDAGPEEVMEGQRKSAGTPRRAFIRGVLGSLAGLGFLPLIGRAGGADGLVRVFTGPTRDGGANGPGASLPPRTIGLRTLGGDFRFDPVGLRIERDARVIWLNMGDFHTTSAFHPANGNLISGEVPLRIPEGAEPWHSGMLGLDAGTEFERRFKVPGVYDYFCQPHYSFGMVGRIIVEEPGNGPAVTRPISELNEASRKQMPAVEAIMGPGGRTYEWTSRINGVLWLRAHGEAVEGPAAALQEAISGDERLRQVLGAAGVDGEFGDRLTRFLSDAGGGTDYETLVGQADAAKDALARARSQA